jgi:hypothetical protein
VISLTAASQRLKGELKSFAAPRVICHPHYKEWLWLLRYLCWHSYSLQWQNKQLVSWLNVTERIVLLHFIHRLVFQKLRN